jgi:hypothetical protein
MASLSLNTTPMTRPCQAYDALASSAHSNVTVAIGKARSVSLLIHRCSSPTQGGSAKKPRALRILPSVPRASEAQHVPVHGPGPSLGAHCEPDGRGHARSLLNNLTRKANCDK